MNNNIKPAPPLNRSEVLHISHSAIVDFWERFNEGDESVNPYLRSEVNTSVEVVLDALRDVGAIHFVDDSPLQ